MPKPTTILNYKIPIVRLYDFNSDIINLNDISNNISLVTTSWYCGPGPINIANNNNNVTILANTEAEKEYYETKTDADVLFCNQNAFLDENLFTIQKVPKKYTLVINSCYNKYKNVYLANNIKNTLHIGYFKDPPYRETVIPTFGSLANFKNGGRSVDDYSFINKNEISKYYNSARVGGIFSTSEGACFASSEMLLCGLPVVSTKCNGGREIWYNNQNSIICKNNKKNVFNCVKLAINNIKKGKFKKETIRNNHIKQMDLHRDILTSHVKDKLEDGGEESIDFDKLKKDLSVFM